MNKRKLFTILSSTAILLSSYSLPNFVNANSVDSLEKQSRELKKQSGEIEGNLSEVEEEMSSLEDERQVLVDEITDIKENINQIMIEIDEQENTIKQLEEKIIELNREIEILQEKIDKRNEVLAEQARGVQTAGAPENIIDLIISSESLSELFGKMEVINSLVKNNSTMIEEQIQDQKSVKKNKAQIDEAKKENEIVKESLETSQSTLLSQEKELDKKVQIVSDKYDLSKKEKKQLLSRKETMTAQSKELDGKIKSEKQRIAKEKAAEEKRRAELAAKAAQKEKVQVSNSDKKTNSNNPATEPKPNPTPTIPKPNNTGWIRPASGRISSEFGVRIHPITGKRKLHAGIDIAGSGAIIAAKEGRVVAATNHPSFGNYVKIDHGNGITSIYAHMLPGLNVSSGQTVSQGQRLGTMGSTGASTGVHLHFEVHQNGAPQNPRNYVSF